MVVYGDDGRNETDGRQGTAADEERLQAEGADV